MTRETALSFPRAAHSLAGIVDTVSVLITHPTVFAGGGVAGVLDAGRVGWIGSIVTDLSRLAGRRCAGVGFAEAVFADLSLGAGHARAGINALAIGRAANLSLVAGDIGAGVRATFSKEAVLP